MKRPQPLLFVLLITLTLVLIGSCLVIAEFDQQTRIALERRGTIAKLVSMLVHENFDGIIDVGTSLASRPLVYKNIEKGKWDEAIKNMERIPELFAYIDTVSLLDKDGVLKAIIPPNPQIIEKSFAYRDYYQEVSKEWSPYVSGALESVIAPKHNIVTVSIPVQSIDHEIIGILVFAIKLDSITSWTKSIDVGTDGAVFVVDRKGQLVAHSNMKTNDDLVSYYSVASVQKLLSNGSGVGIHDKDFASDEKHIAAYSRVEDYEFGIEVLQPTRTAFAERNKQIVELIAILSITTAIIAFFFYIVLRDRSRMRAQHDREITMLESIGDGIVAVDRNLSIILWNKSASMITGWSKEEALGKHIRTVLKIIRESNRKDCISFIEDAMTQGVATSMSDDMLLLKKDGREVYIGDSVAPILGPNKEVNGVIVVFRDTSKERESRHLRSDFAYASHQLRTPITEALWNLEIAIDEQDHDKRKEDLRIVHQSLFSIKKLSEHLVSVSGIDQGDVAVKISPVKFIDVLTEVQSRLEVVAKMRDVTLSITPVSPLMAINTDKKLLSSVIFEIIENAVNYSHRGSKVDVLVTMQEKNLLIEVVDTGVGIPEQEQTIIFTKFFRASNHGSENPGDGLGLYLAKEYTNLIGGKIWFESVEGEGTTFFISLPIV